LRLRHDGVSARAIGRRLGVARSTIKDNLKRTAAAGLSWPLADVVTDEAPGSSAVWPRVFCIDFLNMVAQKQRNIHHF
jgi:hypothetical protein